MKTLRNEHNDENERKNDSSTDETVENVEVKKNELSTKRPMCHFDR